MARHRPAQSSDGLHPDTSNPAETPARESQSSGGLHPAASKRVEKLMADVRKFGRWPLRHARSEDPKLESERLLALRVSKMKAEGCLPPAVVEELEALKAEHRRNQETSKAEYQKTNIEALMAEVREFGRWPEQHAPSSDPKREAERLLAQRVAKMKTAACLPPAVVEELEALEAEHRRSQEISKAEHRDCKIEEMMASVMDLGRWPLVRRIRCGPAQQAEHRLARKVRSEIR